MRFQVRAINPLESFDFWEGKWVFGGQTLMALLTDIEYPLVWYGGAGQTGQISITFFTMVDDDYPVQITNPILLPVFTPAAGSYWVYNYATKEFYRENVTAPPAAVRNLDVAYAKI